MNRSSEPGEGAQYSVAELLARYGDTAPTTGRRRRRAPEDEYYTAPQSIIERIRTDSGPLPAQDRPRRRRAAEADLETREPSWPELDDRASGQPERNGHRRTGLDERGWADLDGGGPGPAAFDGRGRTGRDSSGRDSSGWDSYRPLADRNGSGRSPYWGDASPDEDTWTGLPPGGAGPEARNGQLLSGSQNTEQLPRLDPARLDSPSLDPGPYEAAPPEPDSYHPASYDPASYDSTSPGPAPHDHLVENPTAPDSAFTPNRWPRDEEPPAGLDNSTQLVARQDGGTSLTGGQDDESTQLVPRQGGDDGWVADGPRLAWDDTGQIDDEPTAARSLDVQDESGSDDPEPEPDDPEPDPEGARSPVREWVMMATQIGIGVVGGAVLWLICEWLWQRIPVVALVVALAVITGLVWVVRHVRRAEDLQTTVIAVLVGLFVTVSPAALLLVGR
jgi:hypothetical protein